MSMAKFIRPPAVRNAHATPASPRSTGQLAASFTAPFLKPEDGDMLMLPFYSEGSLSWWTSPTYDATVTVGNLKASYEGNFHLVQGGGTSLGFVHGAGVGALINVDESEHVGLHDFSGGLLLQVGSDVGATFMGTKYTFCTGYDTDGSDIDDTHVGAISFGVLVAKETYSVVFEALFAMTFTKEETYDDWEDEEGTEWDTMFAFMPTITVMAPF